jgi:hypothetical protein
MTNLQKPDEYIVLVLDAFIYKKKGVNSNTYLNFSENALLRIIN